MFESIIKSPEQLKTEAYNRVKTAISHYFDLLVAISGLNNAGVEARSPSLDLKKVFNRSLKDYFNGKSQELTNLNSQVTVRIEIDCELFRLDDHPLLLSEDVGHGLCRQTKGLPVDLVCSEERGCIEAVAIAEQCLGKISFGDIYDNYKKQFDSLGAKENQKKADDIAKLLGFEYRSGTYKSTKQSIAITPSFYVTGELGTKEISKAKHLQSLLAGFSCAAYNALSLLIDAGATLNFNETLPNQKFIGSDLSISYFKTKNELLFSHEFFESIAAYICLHGSSIYASRLQAAIANVKK